MLTPADQALWRDFFAELDRCRPGLEAADMLPVGLVFARVRGRHDDAALVEVGGPEGVTLLTPTGAVAYDLAAMLEAAAAALREGGST